CGEQFVGSFCPRCNPDSFDNSQYFSDHPPQLQFETYLCELCGNNAHYGYDCPPQFPFVYEQEPCYNQNFNDNYFPQNSQSSSQQYLCCANCGGPHDTFQCQPMNEDYCEQNSCYDPNSFGFDQYQPPQFPVNYPPQETSREILQAQEDLMEAIQAFLKEYDHIPPNEKCMALLLAEERFLKIKQAMEEEQNQPEVLQELLLKLINDLQILKGIQQEKKKPTAQSSIPYWNSSMIDDEEARDNFLKDVCTFLRKFSRIPFGVTPKVILIAWESFGKIKDALTDKQYRQEDIQELMSKLLEDVRNISEEFSEYINCPSWNRPLFYFDDDDDEYTVIWRRPKAITPDEPIEEPDNSLSMGDEHLDTISSVEILVPIPTSSSVPWIYMAQFWHTLKEDCSKYRLRFMLDKKELSLTLDDFRTIFHLPQANDNNHNSFVPPLTFSDMVPFYKQQLGWDQPPLQIMQIMYCFVNNIYVDYAELLWEGIYYSIHHPTSLISSGPEKIVLSLHKFPAIIFNDDDIEERTSRWVNKCVKKFNPYARYGVEHWKNPHAKIFYIRKQKEPGKPKEEVYSNSKIIQVIKTYWELGHEHKFVTEIVARRANECIVSITEPDYKNLNKNDIEDMYLLIMNGKVPDYAETGLLWSLSVFIRSSVIWERVHDFQLGIESYQQKVNLTAPTMSFPGVEKHRMFSIIYEPVHGIIYKNSKKEKRVMRHSEIHKFCDATLNRVLEGLKSYNNDVKYGYVQRELTNDEVEYLKLFEEEIEVRLKHRNQMRRWEMYVNGRPLGPRRERPE
ncbi:hypothetical protein Tco_0157998, partial [Tanacetum coccineum]